MSDLKQNVAFSVVNQSRDMAFRFILTLVGLGKQFSDAHRRAFRRAVAIIFLSRIVNYKTLDIMM